MPLVPVTRSNPR